MQETYRGWIYLNYFKPGLVVFVDFSFALFAAKHVPNKPISSYFEC